MIELQGLLDYPRAALTLNDVNQLLQNGPSVKVTAGLEVVHARSTHAGMVDPAIVTLDVSDILLEGSNVAYDNTAKIGGTASLVLDPASWEALGNNSLLPAWAASGSIPTLGQGLYWGNPRTRVRPYLVLSAPGYVAAKFYQGVYILATPNATMENDQPIYTVTCYDQTSIFDIPVTQSLSYVAGTSVFYIINQIITDPKFQIGYESYNFYNIDQSRANATIPYAMSWALNSGSTYLDVLNTMLVSVGYNNLWCDCYGTFQMTPWVSPLELGSQWTFDTTNKYQNILDPAGTWQPDIWQTPNSWIFVENGLTDTPVIGTGLYTITNQSNGPCSIDKQLGRVILSYHEVDAASNPDLITQADKIVLQESMTLETFNVPTSPLPIAGYQDCITLITDNIESNPLTGTNTRVCYVSSWSLPLDGNDMSWNFGTVG